ncbi:LCP family protein [Erysipelothrix aquatica]|uniref:LCP family glycopolymer transferase n=1 Tax=Erysipelothrix aquatica TaxID=2683714 RepID=UPI00135AC841|nr:LCP family protein [Erysipelothrix aquatica]
MRHRKQPKAKRFFDAPFYGILITFSTNIVIAMMIVLAGNYMKIHSEYFTMGIGILVILALVLNITFLIGYAKRVRFMRTINVFFGIALLTVSGVATYYLYKTDSLINQIINISGEESIDYVIVSIDGKKTDKDLVGAKVGYIQSVNPEFETLIQENVQRYSRTSELVEYKDTKSLVDAALNKEIPFAVLPKNYTRLAETVDAPTNPFEPSKSIVNFSTSVSSEVSKVDVVSEPFTLLMLGNNDNLSDSIILATFNPNTMKATMTSVPRDSYVPIACYPGQTFDKINHSRGISRECMIDSVENFLDVDIDFYFETDFYALEKIVDALGGLDIESPLQFAGSFPIENSNPVEYEPITVPEGMNHLDGKQVVTFARERYSFADNDFARQRNQQYVIREIATAIINTRNPNTLVNILDGAKNNISTNMSVKHMTSLMGYAITSIQTSPLEPMETFRIIQSQILGEPDEAPNGASVIRPYTTYVHNTRTLIDQNMETTPQLQGDTAFSFTFSKPYDAFTQNPDLETFDERLWSENELKSNRDRSKDKSLANQETKINGTNDSKTSQTNSKNPQSPKSTKNENIDSMTASGEVKVPDFSSMSRDEIEKWAIKHKIDIEFAQSEQSSEMFNDGQFWSQSSLEGDVLPQGSTIVIHYVVKS